MRAVELRAALEKLPDHAEIIIENRCDSARFEPMRADAWGTSTDEPFLRILTAHPDCLVCIGARELGEVER